MANPDKNLWARFVEMNKRQSPFTRVVVSRGLGEAASLGMAPVVAGVVVNTGLNQPYEDLKKRISRTIIEPNLEHVDNWLKSAKSIDPPFERKEREGLPRDQKAKKITDLLVDTYGLKLSGSLLGQFIAQDRLFDAFDVKITKRQNIGSIVVDRAVQLGSMIVMNTALANNSVKAQEGLINVLKKSGMAEEKAEEWANFAANVGVPNLVAMGASIGLLTHYMKANRGGKI